MAEVREFALPDLGEGLTEATVVQWLVAVGEVVKVDQPVVEVETAKAMVEVPCPYGGVVTARYGKEGAEIPVGTPLVTVAVGSSDDGGGEDGGGEGDGYRDGEGGAARGGGLDEGDAAEGGADDSGNVLVGYGTSAPGERRRRTRPWDQGEREGGAERETSPGSGPGPGPGPGSGPGPESGRGPLAVISPLVRRLARENGVDLHEVTGSGPDGLILRGDVERAAQALAESATAQPAPPPTGPASGTAGSAAGSAPGDAPGDEAGTPTTVRASGTATTRDTTVGTPQRVPLTGMRGTAAERLSRSRREIPDATCWVDADATQLLAARRAMNAHGDAQGAPRIALLALLARICTAALARFPELNATVDTETREIVRLPAVHLGFAAQTDRGLMVPVVRDAHSLDANGLGAELSRLTESARAGTLTPRELTGGTFTLNNYGVFGIDGSTPIINHPEAAMLGVGRIAEKPWVVEGQLAVRSLVQLSFTFDHRVCDGGTAGGFLRYVADCVEQPAVLLRTL